jgi:putative flavoprotein involved in K+ transport
VIGAGHAGLATSHVLAERSIDHVVLERGEVANSWRHERWDSLRLLTPNSQARLPGYRYEGADPNGYMSMADVVAFVARYADALAAPVRTHTNVASVTPGADGGYRVVAGDAEILCRSFVIASGACNTPHVPALRAAVPSSVASFTPFDYRNPSQLPEGGVLVVGASATGVQLAEELRASGRDVTLAVGGHSRLPRTYRGRDIYWWLDRLGVLGRTIDQMPDPVRARREPSAQLIGRPGEPLDLAALAAGGVRLVGRVRDVDGHRVRLAPDLPATVGAAERRLRDLLARVDRHVETTGLRVGAAEPVRAVPLPSPVEELDLRAAGVGSIVWATGYRRAYPWLHLPVLDAHGEIRHRRGRTPVPGLYVLGQRFQHRRNSNFIDGVGRDAAEITEHLVHRSCSICRS